MKKYSNMKFLFSGLMVAITLTTPVSAIVDLQVGVGYAGIDYKDNGSPISIGTLKDNSFKGASLQFAGHLNFSLPLVLSIGVGPYLTFAPDMSFSGATAVSGVAYSNSQMTVGGEVQAKILAIPAISPYLRFGYGADTLKSIASSGGVSVETKLSGSGYRLLFGLELPLAPFMALFAEGGVTGSSYDVTVFTISGLKAKSTGSLFNVGVALNF